jgi:hypothetical protein
VVRQLTSEVLALKDSAPRKPIEVRYEQVIASNMLVLIFFTDLAAA